MKANNYSIHPSVYFIVAALLIAYFFPREGKFRYQFYEGKPWRTGCLPLRATSRSTRLMRKYRPNATALSKNSSLITDWTPQSNLKR